MSYNMMAECPGKLDWHSLDRRLHPIVRLVETFPIPGDSDALGISVPARNAIPDAWLELQAVIEILREEFGCTLIDLYTGQEVLQQGMDQVRRRLLGS